ncbi:MAG TPA: MFS transporter [Rhodospirillales bacterium]|nr:MFS transporter [Rhodospirillales bacterium]
MLILFLIVFIDLVGFGIIIPLLPFFAEHYAASPAMVGFLMASYSLTQFIAAPFWGRISDRFGRRPVLLITLFGAAVSYVLLGVSNSLFMLFIARGLGGFMAGNISAAFAYVADVTTPENRSRGMGAIGAAFGLGFIAGPAIGGILAGPDPINADFRTPALAAAGLSAIALVMAFFILKESLSAEIRKQLAEMPAKNRAQQFRDALNKPGVGLLIGLSFLATFVFAGMETTFAMWSERRMDWGPQQNGYLFAFVGIIAALIQGGLVGKLVKKFGETNLVIQGAAALALGMLSIPFANSLLTLLGAMVVVAYGFSIITPSLNSLVSLQVGPDEQGGVMGVGRSATTLARVIGPAWAGLLFSFMGMDWPYFGGAAVMVLVVVLGLRGLKKIAIPNHTNI